MRHGDRVLFSTTAGRPKARSPVRDARIGLTVFDPANPMETVEVRGTAEVYPDEEGALQRGVTLKYSGGEPPPDPRGNGAGGRPDHPREGHRLRRVAGSPYGPPHFGSQTPGSGGRVRPEPRWRRSAASAGWGLSSRQIRDIG